VPPFAEFVLSAAAARQFPSDALPEIGLVGRSNVGKSSLVNSLLRMNKLARTSNTPGRTQTLNFYRIWPEGKPKFGDIKDPDDEDRFSLKGSALQTAMSAGAFYFVDMPGYGYAKVSASQKAAWRQLIDQYLLTRETLRGVIQVVDLRHPPSKDDIAMRDWLVHNLKPSICVATKADKISRNQRITHLRDVSRGLKLGAEAPPLLFSAEEGIGRDELWKWVVERSQLSPIAPNIVS